MIPATYVGVRTYPTDARYGRTRHTCPEEWRPIEGGWYEVSSHGRIRRLSARRGTRVGSFIRPHHQRDGRVAVELRQPEGRRRLSVGWLVCTAFHGPQPPGTDVCHLNADLSDDHADNLRWLPAIRAFLIERQRIDENGCWNWTGTVAAHGYGMTNRTYVHRMAYEEFVGPIPDGLQIDHLCRNRCCFNPDHLEAVTPAENMRRGEAPSAMSLREGRCHNGHPRTPENTYIRPDKGTAMCRDCARESSARRKAKGAAS